jgi:hypothetical protein
MELGTIVTEESTPSDYSLDEARIVIRLTNDAFDKIALASQHKNFASVEDYCLSMVMDSLNEKVGKAHITSPGELSGAPVTKIMGPSNSGMVRRA